MNCLSRVILSLCVVICTEGVVAEAAHGQNVIVLRAGAGGRTQVTPGAKVAIPVVIDLAGAGGTVLGSLTTGVKWASSRLTFDSVRSAGFGTLTSNTTGAAGGAVNLAALDAAGTASTVTMANLYFTAASTSGGTTVGLTPTVAGSSGGSSIISLFRVRNLDVCVAPSGLWGDVNADAAVNIIDAQQIARASVGLSVANAFAVAGFGDVTGDSAVDIIDAQQIARYAVGMSAPARVNAATFAAPAPTTVTMSQATVLTTVGTATQLAATPKDATNNPLNGCMAVTWSTSSSAVATVDSTGRVVGVGNGSATITVMAGGRTAQAAVSVGSPAIESVAAEAMRLWFNAYDGCEGNCVLVTQAQSFSASWNNWNMNFYSSIDADGTRNTRAWQNDPALAGRTSIEGPWDRMYAVISSASDVLRAIRTDNAVINNAADTKRAETIAQLMLGAGLSYIALNFDKGYVIDETVDLGALAFSNRRQLRDAALAKFDDVIALATANSFTTPAAWTNGIVYDNTKIARIANTMAAMLLAYYPRNAAENAIVNWAQVLTYASNGMSNGTPVDFAFAGDGCVAWCPDILMWFDAIDTGRLHTRVANLMDPVTQQTPWPITGNPQPNTPDKRMGDGSFGDASITFNFGTVPKTANAGTDFAWSSQAIFRPDRGSYHQSNIGFIRYDQSGVQDPSSIYGGYGWAPVISAGQSELLWAEALIRSGGSLADAATRINKTRVTRGGLPAATAADGVSGLTGKLGYEMEIELLGLGPAPYYWRRRTDGLIVGTPHEMPVPAKVLNALGLPLYTWGGTGPANSATPP